MKRLLLKNLLLAVGVAWGVVAFSDVKFGAPFGDGMVLQQDVQVPVWGTAATGETVSVAFGGQCQRTVADAHGRWCVHIGPLSASAAPCDLIAASDRSSIEQSNNPNNRAVLHDVLVGEVWLCSGQSNMELNLWGEPRVSEHGNHDANGILDAMMTDEPLVRFTTVPKAWSAEPKPIEKPLAWDRMRFGNQQGLSAIAFHYSLMLHRALKVPVGVIVSSWGGTDIRPWISPKGYAGGGDIGGELKLPRTGKQSPTALWNAMIHPLLPFAVKGVLWYQGEYNNGEGMRYLPYMHALWRSYAADFGNPKIPLYYVQIAPFHYWHDEKSPHTHACDIWEAQARFERENACAGMVSTVDIADWDNIHPGDKRTVALRLAALALNRTYGRRDVPCASAKLVEARVADGVFKLRFRDAGQWILFGLEDAPFELAGADGVWQPAKATYRPDEIDLKSDKVPAPKAFRYLWNWRGHGRLKNCFGLPLTPIPPTFESDGAKRDANVKEKRK